MCCLFGMIDYGRYFTGRQRSQILSVLATECEARGTDATGLAYSSRSELHVYKRPLPAHKLHIRLLNDARVIMGHTRMMTQGSAKKNYNNHTFRGSAGGFPFALAHNGVLHNDLLLRKEQKLPKTKIETDSFVAVQLLEQQKALDFDSLKRLSHKLCKPQKECRIESLVWRFDKWEEEIAVQKKRPVEQRYGSCWS